MKGHSNFFPSAKTLAQYCIAVASSPFFLDIPLLLARLATNHSAGSGKRFEIHAR